MDRFEIFTIGGGRYLFNFFNAMAAIAQSDAYAAVITSAVMIGGIWISARIVINQQTGAWQGLPRHMLLVVCLLYGALYPKATVKITDTIDPVNSGGYIVANVPWGPAFLTSLFTMASHEITALLENNLVDADAPKYARNGMVFGATLLANATRLEIRDTSFSASMGSFIRSCLYYDILHGRKSMDDLMKAADPWAYIISDPAKSRWFEIHDTDSTSGRRTTVIKTCAAGVGDLTAKWNRAVRQAATSLALANAPHRINRRQGGGYVADSAQLRLLTAHLQTNLQAFHRYLIGASRASGEILRRQMTINAIMNEAPNWNAETGNAAALERLAAARVDLQTERSYNLAGRQALQWVPATHATLQAVFAILFLLVFPVWLMPNGLRFMGYYVVALAWLATWGPVMVILNYIYTSSAQEEMRAAVMQADVALQDIPYMASAGIKTVEAKIANSAGNMMIITGGITLALFAGVGRWAHIAGDNLRVAQEANAAAAAEATTGNLSYGNTGTGSHSFENINGYHTSMSSSWDSTRSIGYSNTGAQLTQTGDGRWVAAGGTSQSAFATNIVGDTRMAESFAQDRAESLQAANDIGIDLSNSKSAAMGLSNSFTDSVMRGSNSDFVYDKGESFKASEDISTVKSAAKSWGETHGFKEDEVIKAGANLSASGALNLLKKGPLNSEIRGQLQAGYDANNSTSVSFDDAMKFARNEDVRDALGRLTTAGISQKAGWQLGESENFATAQQANYQEIESLSEKQSAALQRAERMGTAANLVDSSSSAINTSLNQPFFEWLQTQPSLRGEGTMSAMEAEALLNSNRGEDRETAIALGHEFLEQGGWREISDPRIRAAFEEINPEQKYATDSAGIKSNADIEGQAVTNAGRIESGDKVRGTLETRQQEVTGSVQGQMSKVQGEMQDKREQTESEVQSGAYRVSTERNKTIPEQAGHVVGQVANAGGEVLEAGKQAFKDWRAEDGSDDGSQLEPRDPSLPPVEGTSLPKALSGMGQPNKLPKGD